MSETKHTPGPWRAWPTHNAGDVPYVEAVRGGPRLCTMSGNTDEDFANARLIAAAPGLLKACIFALSVQKSNVPWDLSEKMNIERLEAAIKKATE